MTSGQMDHWTGRTTAQKCQSLIRLQYRASELLGLKVLHMYLAFDCTACIWHGKGNCILYIKIENHQCVSSEKKIFNLGIAKKE